MQIGSADSQEPHSLPPAHPHTFPVQLSGVRHKNLPLEQASRILLWTTALGPKLDTGNTSQDSLLQDLEENISMTVTAWDIKLFSFLILKSFVIFFEKIIQTSACAISLICTKWFVSFCAHRLLISLPFLHSSHSLSLLSTLISITSSVKICYISSLVSLRIMLMNARTHIYTHARVCAHAHWNLHAYLLLFVLLKLKHI